MGISIAIGAFLIPTRVVFGTSGSMANSDHVVGAPTITVAIIALAKVVRALRFIDVLLGAWLVVTPRLLGGASTAALASVALGLALLGLSLPHGNYSREHHAGRDRFIL